MATERLQLIGCYYQQAHDELVRMTTARVHCRQLAEDVVHDAFLRVMTSDTMVMEQSLPGLLYRVVTNLLFDRWRRWNHSQRFLRAMTASDLCCEDTATATAMHELTTMLTDTFSRLDAESARIMTMSVMEEKKVSEIADELQLPYKRVENRLYAARKTVRRQLLKVI